MSQWFNLILIFSILLEFAQCSSGQSCKPFQDCQPLKKLTEKGYLEPHERELLKKSQCKKL